MANSMVYFLKQKHFCTLLCLIVWDVKWQGVMLLLKYSKKAVIIKMDLLVEIQIMFDGPRRRDIFEYSKEKLVYGIRYHKFA